MEQSFRCINNDAMNKALEMHYALVADFDKESAKIAAEFGGEVQGNYWRNGRRAMVGIKIKKGDADPGKSWRMDNGYGHLYNEEDVYVPNARTNAGKELRKRLEALTVDSFVIPGLPMNVFLSDMSLMLTPGTYQIGDNWYASYSHAIPDSIKHVDRDIWEDMRNSDLMRLREDEAIRKEQEAKDSEVRDAQGNVARIEA